MAIRLATAMIAQIMACPCTTGAWGERGRLLERRGTALKASRLTLLVRPRQAQVRENALEKRIACGPNGQKR